MNQTALKSDDLSVNFPNAHQLGKKLKEVIRKRFWNDCQPTLQKLLSSCRWDLTLTQEGLTLILFCPNQSLYQEVVESFALLRGNLQKISQSATIMLF